MNKGKHASDSAGSFYRDLAMMLTGILMVGAAVFLLLYLFAGDSSPGAGEPTSSSSPGSTSTSSNPSSTTTAVETTTSSSSTTSTTVPVRPPEEVRVVVLNSIDLSGAAARKTQELADAGYQTQQADDFEPEQDPSRIWYRDGFAAEANVLLDYLPGALVEPLPDLELEQGSDVVLVLGTGYEE
jgi:hypothetical protein